MPPYSVQGVLLDIEGTTSSISFVYDKMFPFVRENLSTFLQSQWSDPQVQECIPLLAQDLEHENMEAWFDGADSDDARRERVENGVIKLMDGDVKATGLKQLQGLIWKDGFHSGQLVAHLFDDVAPAIKTWKEAGIDVRIYSSGSIAAQKLFFGHCIAGDLLDQFSGHYDTTTGSKKEADSYRTIVSDFGIAAEKVLFVSDVVDELMAAQTAGLQTCLSLRPGNKDQGESEFAKVSSFAEIEISQT